MQGPNQIRLWTLIVLGLISFKTRLEVSAQQNRLEAFGASDCIAVIAFTAAFVLARPLTGGKQV